MALGPRLDLRQSQSLVMTPQLQQAIKLLALSNLEIETFIGEALEANPLLEAGEVRAEDRDAPPEGDQPEIADSTAAGDEALDIDPTSLDIDRDTGDWSAEHSGSGAVGEAPDLENHSNEDLSLADHLEAQVGAQVGAQAGLGAADAQVAFIARHIIGLLDEAGYLSTDLRDIAISLDVPLARVEEALAVVQSLDPTGVGARSLSECLALQAKEADRYDPCMEVLIDNLELVAKGAVAHLKRICRVDDEDFAEMLSELRGYDPKPGLKFGGSASGSVVPDVLLAAREGGTSS